MDISKLTLVLTWTRVRNSSQNELFRPHYYNNLGGIFNQSIYIKFSSYENISLNVSMCTSNTLCEKTYSSRLCFVAECKYGSFSPANMALFHRFMLTTVTEGPIYILHRPLLGLSFWHAIFRQHTWYIRWIYLFNLNVFKIFPMHALDFNDSQMKMRRG